MRSLLLRVALPALCPVVAHAQPIVFSDVGQELGTTYDVVVIADSADGARVTRDLAHARALCHRLEAQLSEWRSDSEISRLNARAAAEPVHVSADLARVLRGAAHVSAISSGAFDITWRPLGELWDAAAVADRYPTATEVNDRLRGVGWHNVVMDGDAVSFEHPDVQLGIAGVAKGWIIDSLFLFLRERGYENVIVNVGGDLRVSGLNSDGLPHTIWITHPQDPTHSVATLGIRDTAMATSGNYLRRREIAGRVVGHIVDPRSGYPPEFDGSVTVLTRDAAMADALATAFFVLGPDEGIDLARTLPGVDVVYVTDEGLRTTLEPDDPTASLVESAAMEVSSPE